MKGLKSLLAICCTLLPLFTTQARAENEVDSTARSAVIIERKTGQVLLEHNANVPLPMASTTKVMTALMALEYGKLEEMVTVGRNAYGVPGTSIYLNLGETISLHDLLCGLLLASGNDAAVAIAEHIGGDVPAFCRMMTQRAQELGCRDTVFANPHGLPAHDHHTTAEDLALIAREAMKHEVFRQIVSTQRASIPWEGRTYPRILNNKNRLLSSYEGATGIKTGYTRAAGRCLVFGAKRGNMEVIGVVLNCSNWFEEAARLMDLAYERYEGFTALSSGEMIRVLPVVDGKQETVRICAGAELYAVVPKGSVPVWILELPDQIQAGTQEGECVGQAMLQLDSRTLATIPLVNAQSLARRDYAFELDRLIQHWPILGEPMAQ